LSGISIFSLKRTKPDGGEECRIAPKKQTNETNQI
jgi:hypothetical protein